MLRVDIKKTFGSKTMSFNLEFKDTISSVLGPSGCGKSTLLKCIAGLITPDEGRVVLGDKVLFDSSANINIPPQKRRVGYCFQNYALFPNMNVEKNIHTGLHNIKDKAEAKKIFNEVVETLELEGILQQSVNTISGGEAQRVALARMLVNKPDIFLFDEVFSSLDYELSNSVQKYVKSLILSFSTQSIFVTHNPEEAQFLSNNIFYV